MHCLWRNGSPQESCHEDVFCTRCRTRSHATEGCRVPVKTVTSNIICIYCGSVGHISGSCHNKPNDNREEPRSTPRDLRDQKPNKTYNRMSQPQVSHHQARFDEGLNKQYLPNYVNHYQSPLGSIPGQDLSAKLKELANIQSRSLEMMAASQRSQREAFQELTRASRDKANDAMFTPIKIFDGTNRQAFEEWIDEIDQACRASDRDFRTEIFKKSAGAVQQVVLSCDKLTDDELVAKLRSCFSHAPTMNEVREELQNMKQLEHESVSVYMYRWGRALYQSSGIQPDNERHPHVIKDFISSLKRNIRNKIANRWAEMQHPPSTIKKAFKLASDVEKQLQVADSFKLEFPSYPSNELNEMSTEETSGDEMELNKISRGKRWGNNNNRNQKHSSFSNNRSYNYKPQQNRPQDNQGKQWEQRPKDSKITLTQESDHYVPTELSSNFFRQFDLAMKLKWGELKKQGRSSNQVNEITEGNLIQAFGVTEDEMEKAATILSRNEGTKNWEIHQPD